MLPYQRSVTHDSLRYINILTYLLTYLLINIINSDDDITVPFVTT